MTTGELPATHAPAVAAVDVLCVCTYNRTRSVIMEALLRSHLSANGVRATVHSAGEQGDGEPPTPTTVELLAARGIDVAGHRSRRLDAETIEAADVIVTAERAHVVAIAGRWPTRFDRAFTLPELVFRTRPLGGKRAAPVAAWLQAANLGRPRGHAYVHEPADFDIADPTGSSLKVWRVAFDVIDTLTADLAGAMR